VLNVSEFVILTAAQTNMLSYVIDWQFTVYMTSMCAFIIIILAFLFIFIYVCMLALVLLVKWSGAFCGKVHTVSCNSKYIKDE